MHEGVKKKKISEALFWAHFGQILLWRIFERILAKLWRISMQTY